jgi:hypothetical protein
MLTCERLTSSVTRPLIPVAPGRCEACGCRLSRYRDAAETLCAPCSPTGGLQDQSGSGKAEAGSVTVAILEALRAGPMSRADITTLTGCPTSSVKAALRVLVARQQIERGGTYSSPLYRLR